MLHDLFLLWLGGAISCSVYVLCEVKRGLGGSAAMTAEILPGRFYFALVVSVLIWPVSLARIYQMIDEEDDPEDDQEDDQEDDDEPPPRAVAVPATRPPASPTAREAPE